MKFNKKIMAGAVAGLMAISSLALAANERRNLSATYGVNLVVNGSPFYVTDNALRPFVTQDGRTYMSIAGLKQTGLVSVAFDPATKTVSVKSASTGSSSSVAQLEAQVLAQSTELTRVQAENVQLKAELEKLKASSSSNNNNNTNKNTGSKHLSDLDRSTRRDFEKSIKDEIRYLRADSTFNRSQRFEGEVSVGSKDVTITLTQSPVFTENDKTEWNKLVGGSRSKETLEDDYASFLNKEVKTAVASILKDYKDYNIYITISANDKANSKIVEADYNSSRNRTYSAVYSLS